MRSSTKIMCIFMVCLVLALSSNAVWANPTISLSWYKNNGLGIGNNIGGQWTITAQVSYDVTYVEFYLDNQLQQNATTTPYSWSFNTADYTNGIHTIKSVAYNTAGETATAEVDRNFVEYSTNLLFIILGVIVAVVAISLVVALYWVRKKGSKK